MNIYLELAEELLLIASGESEYSMGQESKIMKDAAHAIIELEQKAATAAERNEPAPDSPDRELTVFYVCDRRACNRCAPECRHTMDVRHAKNFEVSYCGGVIEEREHATL